MNTQFHIRLSQRARPCCKEGLNASAPCMHASTSTARCLCRPAQSQHGTVSQALAILHDTVCLSRCSTVSMDNTCHCNTTLMNFQQSTASTPPLTPALLLLLPPTHPLHPAVPPSAELQQPHSSSRTANRKMLQLPQLPGGQNLMSGLTNAMRGQAPQVGGALQPLCAVLQHALQPLYAGKLHLLLIPQLSAGCLANASACA
jgi:hypothetical protein